MNSTSPSWAEMVRVFGRIGLMSFGGPAGQIALMHRELVEGRAWLDEPRFLHALNFCMLLPGPEAMQLATYSGWLMRGVAGGLLAGLLFILPGFAVILALSAVYFHFGEMPVVAGVLFGLKAAVLAIVVEALIKVSRRALKGRLAWGLAVSAFIAIAFLHLPFPLIVLGAGAIG
ncbi:chromate transporter, partial [Hoeflea sp. BAL378]